MKSKKKKGFTLTELIVVIVIIGVLAAVLIPSLTGYITKAQNAKDDALVASLNKSYQNSKIIDNTNFYNAYDVKEFLKSIEMEEVDVANKKSIILFDTNEDKFVLIKENEQEEAFYVNDGETKKLNNEGEFVSHISEYYKINDSFYNERTDLSSSEEKLTPLSNKTQVDNSILLHRTFIVSTSGLEISKVVNDYMNIDFNTTSEEVKDFYNSISNPDLKLIIYESLERTAFYSEEGVFYFDANDDFKRNETSDLTNKKLSRLFILNSVENVDLESIQGLSKVTVFIPGTTANVNVSLVTLENNNNLNLTGNKSAINCDDIPDRVIQETDDANILLYIKELTFVDGNVESESELRTIIYEYLQKLNETVTINNVTKTIKEFIKNDLSEEVGSFSTIYVVNSFTIENDIEIPEGVELRVLYDNNNKDDKFEDGKSNTEVIAFLYEKKYKKNELTIADNAIVTVKNKGIITVCGIVTEDVGSYYEGQTSEDYAQITNNGTIKLENAAKLDVYGYVMGSGTIIAESGATIIQPFTIMNYGGGSNSKDLIDEDKSPFGEYALLNIQCNVEVNYGALYQARARIYVATLKNESITIGSIKLPIKTIVESLEKQNKVSNYRVFDTINIITYDGSTEKDALIILCNNSKVKISYSDEKLVNQIGCLNFEIEGKDKAELSAKTGALTIDFPDEIKLIMADIDTSEFNLPLPYNFSFIFSKGNYILNNEFSLLTGSSMIVNEDAKLTISENSSLYIIDKIDTNVSFSGIGYYPKGLDSAKFIVKGEVEVNGTLAGDIITSGKGKIVVSESGNAEKNSEHKCVDEKNHKHWRLVTYYDCDTYSEEYKKCWIITYTSYQNKTITFGGTDYTEEFSFTFNENNLLSNGTYYTVTFKYEDSEEVKLINSNIMIDVNDIKTKEGFTILLYKDAEMTEEWKIESDCITESIPLYVKYVQ